MKRFFPLTPMLLLVASFSWTLAQTDLKTSFIFLPKETYTSGTQNWSLACGDIDKDGTPDLVTASRGDSRVHVHYNDGTGDFAKHQGFASEQFQRALCLFDANGDEWLDAATITVTGKLCLLLNDGKGALVKKSVTEVKGNLHDVTPGDFNGDGKIDLAVVSVGEKTLSILINDGTGAWKMPLATVLMPQAGRVVKVADLDEDGLQDLVVGCDDDRVYMYRNNGGQGKAMFTLHSTLKSGKSTWALTVADLNGDNRPDIAAIGYEDKNLFVHYNLGGMQFKSMPAILGGDHTFDLTTGDIDGDGKKDLAACSTIDFSIIYFRNNGEAFEPMGTLASGNWNSGIVANDFDKDGTIDIATSSINDNNVNLHYNAIAFIKESKAKPPFVFGSVYEGKPAKNLGGGITVELFDSKGNLVGTTTTDSLGRYALDAKPTEFYTIKVTQPGKEPFTKTFTMPSWNIKVNILLKAPSGPYTPPAKPSAPTTIATTPPATTQTTGGTSAPPQTGQPSTQETTLMGFVRDEKTGNPIGKATVEITDALGNIVRTVTSKPDGSYRTTLPPGKYDAITTATGYFYQETIFEIPESRPAKQEQDMTLLHLEVGASIVLKNILFDTGKSSLRDVSRAELARLSAIMKQNPGLFVEIAGHTDDVGAADNNKRLSQDRAESVVNFLMDEGIGLERLTPVGYGEEKPIVLNDTAEHRQENRRTECKILKIETQNIPNK